MENGEQLLFLQLRAIRRNLYEAACYLVTFAICMWLYFKKEAWKKEGLIFGVFMICVFGSRFFIEFVKNDQEEPFEADMMLNMGQWLSIPFVLAGCLLRLACACGMENWKLRIEDYRAHALLIFNF